jgi:hypothetical protein
VTETRPEHQVVYPEGIASQTTLGIPTIWQMYRFAPEWFADALLEARAPSSGPTSRRREIVFAVCVAEAYLIEWVLDEVLGHDCQTLSVYFKQGASIGICDRWKGVMDDLFKDQRIAAVPDRSGTVWRDFNSLVKYRNGLVHARSSRPSTAGTDPESVSPTLDELGKCSPGWPTNVVVSLIVNLHSTLATSSPTWLVKP